MPSMPTASGKAPCIRTARSAASVERKPHTHAPTRLSAIVSTANGCELIESTSERTRQRRRQAFRSPRSSRSLLAVVVMSVERQPISASTTVTSRVAREVCSAGRATRALGSSGMILPCCGGQLGISADKPDIFEATYEAAA